jgi:lysophospholipase L1-like esterase
MGVRGRHIGLGAAIVALVLFAVWATNRAPSPPGTVLLVGDSLFFQSADELTQMVEADGWSVDVQAGIGSGIVGGGLLPSEWETHLAPIVEEKDPEVVVIELGTNGCGPSCDGLAREIDAVLQTVDEADVVVWLTVRTAPTPDAARIINQEIDGAQNRWGNLVVAPMDRWFAGRSDLIDPDNVHLNAAGQHHLAQNVTEVIRQHTG